MLRLLWLGTSAIALGQCAAMAQSAAPAAGDEDAEATLGTVTVTAERRDTDLQSTPIAATVLSGDDLADLGVITVDQLQFITPAATVNNFGQGIDFNIRGIGKAEHNTQTTTGVITYRDGVAKFPGYFTAEPYYDIASVEVLRGPQGTFVGQNATGGAVFVTSKDPIIGGGNTGYVMGQLGNYGDIAGQGAVNLPISDTLAARVAFFAESRESFYEITGPYTGDDGVNIAAIRGSLLWEPNSALSVLFKTDYNSLDLSAYPADPHNAPNDPFELTANADLQGIDRFVRSVLKVNYEFENGIVLRSVSGYQDGTTSYKADLDGTSAGNSTFRDKVDETIWSQEINLISPDTGRFGWIVGAYYQWDEYDFLPGEFVIGAPPGSIFTEYQLEGQNPKEAAAIFGQVSYAITEDLEVQLGGRYSEHSTTNDIYVSQYGTPIEQHQTAEYDNWSGKLALNWQVSEDHFLYGFVATGFRPGGLNVPVGLGDPEPFDEELVTSYEIGWKADWMNGHVRTQLTAFHNDYDQFQVQIGYPDIPVFSFQLNTPETTKIDGIEAEVQALLGNLSLSAGLGAMQSELGTFYAVDPRVLSTAACNPESGPESASCINLDGRDQTYAPNFTFNLAAQYELKLDNGDTVTPKLNYGHVSEQWATLFQNESLGDKIGERDILNGQVSWQSGTFTTTFYATNITNQQYVGALNTGLRFMGPPRQYGVRVMKVF